MGRAPCCEKIGLKKGPWSHEEDHILISHILQHGHANWRQLPKLAGLLRCGKSCRLRWTNYLSPDVKRGNFSKEEEETIISLHEMLGNRWSAIAARLPGRTDNEIKNVWHTHLKKKKLKDYQSSQDSNIHAIISNPKCDLKDFENSKFSPSEQIVICPQDPSISEISGFSTSSDISYGTDSSMEKVVIKKEEMENSSKYFPQINESFLSEELSTEDISSEMGKIEFQFPLKMTNVDSEIDDRMEFWYNLFIRAGEMADLQDFL